MQKILLALVVAMLAMLLLLAYTVDRLRGRCSKLEKSELRFLLIREDGKLKSYLQRWDGTEWTDTPIVKNEDLED